VRLRDLTPDQRMAWEEQLGTNMPQANIRGRDPELHQLFNEAVRAGRLAQPRLQQSIDTLACTRAARRGGTPAQLAAERSTLERLYTAGETFGQAIAQRGSAEDVLRFRLERYFPPGPDQTPPPNYQAALNQPPPGAPAYTPLPHLHDVFSARSASGQSNAGQASEYQPPPGPTQSRQTGGRGRR
jgi:hypothetical protein